MYKSNMICSHFQVVNEPADAQRPVVEMSSRSKLSCLSWNKYAKNHIASSDYEGIVTIWDVSSRQVVSVFRSFIFDHGACFKSLITLLYIFLLRV